MVETVRRTGIQISVDDDASRPAKTIKRSLDDLGTSAAGAVSGVNLLQAALVGLAAVQVSAALKSAISTTIDFNKAVSNLSAITGAVGKDLDTFSSKARDIGKTTTLSATQAVTAFKLVGSLRPELLQVCGSPFQRHKRSGDSGRSRDTGPADRLAGACWRSQPMGCRRRSGRTFHQRSRGRLTIGLCGSPAAHARRCPRPARWQPGRTSHLKNS